MIAWSISAAACSGCFDRIVVSTDDNEVASVAKAEGAEVPFVRPEALSDDYTATRAVIAHAIRALALDPKDAVCCLYATAPFVVPDDLRAGLDLLCAGGCSYVFPVTHYAFPIQRALRMDASGRVEMFQPDQFQTRSQDLEEAVHDVGQFYWAHASQWQRETPIFGPGAIGLPIPRHRAQDIDTPEDWDMAERLFRAGNPMP